MGNKTIARIVKELPEDIADLLRHYEEEIAALKAWVGSTASPHKLTIVLDQVPEAAMTVVNTTQNKTLWRGIMKSGQEFTQDIANGDTITITPGVVFNKTAQEPREVVMTSNLTEVFVWEDGAEVCPFKLTIDLIGVATAPIVVRNVTQGITLDSVNAGDGHVFDRNIRTGDTINVTAGAITGYVTPAERSFVLTENITAPLNYIANAPAPADPATQTPGATLSKVGPANAAAITVPVDAVDVSTYGAKGDGVSDDTTALQAALNAGVNLKFSGRTYIISSQIVLTNKSNITLHAQGAKIQAKSTFTNGQPLLRLTGCTNVTVYGFTLTGNGGTTFDNAGIKVLNGSGMVLSANTISNLGGCGISAETTDGLQVLSNYITGTNYHGIWSDRSTNMTVKFNSCRGIGSSNNGGGTSTNSGSIGFLGTGGHHYLVEGNLIQEYANTTCKTEGASNVTMRFNTIKGFAVDGIKIMADPARGINGSTDGVLEYNDISGFSGVSQYGSSYIQISSIQGFTVRNNIATGVEGWMPAYGYEDGIRVQTHGSGTRSSNGQIYGNTISNVVTGIRIDGDTITIYDNHMTKLKVSNKFGSTARGANITYRNNDFATLAGTQITLLVDNSAATTGLAVYANKFVGNGSGAAIYAEGAATGTIGNPTANTYSGYTNNVKNFAAGITVSG